MLCERGGTQRGTLKFPFCLKWFWIIRAGFLFLLNDLQVFLLSAVPLKSLKT